MCYGHWSVRKQWYCHTLTQTAENSHTLKLSKLSFDTREVVAFLWLPKMSLPDLRDDVIGFFKRLKHLSNLSPLLCRVL